MRVRDNRLPNAVIASEAKQSSFAAKTRKAGLLRRFAPRNDGERSRRKHNAGRIKMKKNLILTLAGTAFLLCMASPTIAKDPAPSIASAARRSVTDVAGLKAPAEILVDVWGIPHLYAANEHDLFFLQGFNAARDRLWQIDLWRKRGLGLLAKDFGPAYVEQDR